MTTSRSTPGTVLTVLLVALPMHLAGCGGEETAAPTPDAATESVEATTPSPPAPAPASGTIEGASPGEIDRIVEHFNRGVGLMDRFQPVDAIKAFEEVVRLAPGWTTGRLNYGIALLNGQTDESYAGAEVELNRVIDEAPDNPYAHYALGMLLRHLTRFDEARVRFERVLVIDPDDPDAHYQLGILTADTEPEVAREHLERTLAAIPHHESACYRLQSLLREAGEPDAARAYLVRFRELKTTGAGVFSGMKYGEMGRYAEIVRAFPGLAEAETPNVALAYADVGKSAGLALAGLGHASWPGASAAEGAAAFGPGVGVTDVDGDGDLDFYITGVGPEARGALYENEAGRFAELPETGIDGRDAIGAFFADVDDDGDPDLYLTCAGRNRLYRNDGAASFTDITAEAGVGGGPYLSVGAAWADADHDGDIDLYVANFARVGADPSSGRGVPNALWRNNGDGSFSDVAPEAGIDCGSAASVGVLFFDADDDRDLDLYVVNDQSSNRLFLNDRVGRYSDATARFDELADDGAGLGAALGDVDLDGREDLLLLKGAEPPRLFLQRSRGSFEEDEAFAAIATSLGGAVGGSMGDLDLDGDLDLVLFGAGDRERTGHRLLLNDGGGHFDPPVTLGEDTEAPDARGAVAVDFDGDGALELLVARAGALPQLWRAPAPEGLGWLEVVPAKTGEDETLRADPGALGLLVEVKTGRRLQVASITSSEGYLGGQPGRAHFGLGGHSKADYVRLSWPDAVLQAELEVAANQKWQVVKVLRKPSSCPILFTWHDGRFHFVTDFLGVGGIGFFVAPGEYAPPDPTEDVRIPPELVSPRDGRFVLRIAEPLEEVTYLDEVHLIAYDHPADWEIHPDERFAAAPPFPTGRPYAVDRKIFPAAARSDREDDVRERLLEIDRAYVEPPKDSRFVGYAHDHWIELDFEDRLAEFDPDARLVLYLYGWVEYTYSRVNYAAQQAGLTMRSPSIEVPDGEGGWRVAIPDAGFPAGLPRMMTLDISSLPIRDDGRLRIRTNMEVFWDQVFIGKDVASPQMRAQILPPVLADLRPLGYPREYSPDGADPTLYDYHRLDQGVPFKNLTGNFTSFGDVRWLLREVDDQFVIMARGEEIALEFDATGLAPLPDGWARTLVLHADGYCKDMDLYTAFPDTVAPLPFHGMENYPPATPAPVPAEYEPRSNTRRVEGQ